MTKTISLAAVSRTAAEKLTPLRDRGLVPAVLYGHGSAAQSLSIKKLELERAYASAGESSLVDLALESAAPVKVIIKAIQRDPVTNKISHADLYSVRMDEAIEIDVPLEFTGISVAVTDLGGTLVKARDAVTVKCLPGAIPDLFTVDLSSLKTFEDAIHARDLALPNGVELLTDLDEPLAHVLVPRVEEEPAPVAAEAAVPAAAPEATKDGKDGKEKKGA